VSTCYIRFENPMPYFPIAHSCMGLSSDLLRVHQAGSIVSGGKVSSGASELRSERLVDLLDVSMAPFRFLDPAISDATCALAHRFTFMKAAATAVGSALS